MKKLIKQLIPICCFYFYSSFINAQILTDYPCFAVANNNGTINNLHMYNPETNEWNLVGNTETNNIAAIAADSKNGLLYTVDSAEPGSNNPATFGMIDLDTGFFMSIGVVGEGMGEFGNIQLNRIEGLAYDLLEQTLFAVHKVEGSGQGTNDLLFQIDVATGKVVANAMLDPGTGSPVDYVIIPEIFDSSFLGDVYDVSDIAILPVPREKESGYSFLKPGDLLAIQDENGPGTLTVLNKKTGEVESVVFDFTDDDVEGLGFSHLGELYATTGDDGFTQQNQNTFIYIDLDFATTTTLSYIDQENPIDVNFESFDCFYDMNTIIEVEAPDFACYAVAKNNGTVNNLFQFDLETYKWREIGNTNTKNIGAIATDSNNGILYTVESASPGSNTAATFGTINLQTGAFSVIGPIGEGMGDFGNIQLNQIEGLAYDQEAQILYAVHKVDGNGPGTNDLLFQIDVATGKVIPNAMLGINVGLEDYSVVPAVFDGSFAGDVYDVSDIAIYPTTTGDNGIQNFEGGELVAMHAQNGPGIITQLNKKNADISAVLYDLPDDDVESLGFTHLGDLFATTGDDGITQQNSNTFILIDINEGITTTLIEIDQSSINVDFESFDCFHAIIRDQPQQLCQTELQLPREIQSGIYKAEEITSDKDMLNYTGFSAEVSIIASKSVTLNNILLSNNCNLSIDSPDCSGYAILQRRF